MLRARKQGQNGLVAPPKATTENIFTWTGLKSLVSSEEHKLQYVRVTQWSSGVSLCHKNPNTAPTVHLLLNVEMWGLAA